MEFKLGDLIQVAKYVVIGWLMLILSPLLILLGIYLPFMIFFNPLTWIGMFLLWFNRQLN